MTICRTLCIAAIASVIATHAPGAAHARDMVGYEVVGEAREADSNARARALDKAFAAAVKRALRDVLTKPVRRKHAATLRKKLIRRARLHVVSYRVQKQRVVEGKLKIKVGVLIDRDKLRATLSKLGIDATRATATASAHTRPKVMVLLHATVSGKTHVTYGNAPSGRDGGSAGRAFVAALKGRGFDVIISSDPPPVSRNAEAGMPMDDTAATTMAKKASAGGVFIVGIEVQGGGAIRGTKLKGATGRAQVRLLDVTKGKVVARATISDAGFGKDAAAAADKAAARVGGRALDKVGEAAQRYWPTSPAISGGIPVVVRGDIHWTAIAALLGSLRAATDVSAASMRRFRPGEVAIVLTGPIANMAKAAAVTRAAAIVNGANLGSYIVKTAPEGGGTLAVTLSANKVTP